MRWLVTATLATALCAAAAAHAASPLDAPDPLAAPADAGKPACKKKAAPPQGHMQMTPIDPGQADECAGEPKIGPPVDTGGPAPCVSNVFEKGQGCACPPGMPVREEVGDPAKIGAEHVMVWCRRGGSRR